MAGETVGPGVRTGAACMKAMGGDGDVADEEGVAIARAQQRVSRKD